MKEILIISDNQDRKHNLNIILTFLGESVSNTDYKHAIQTINTKPNLFAVLIDGEIPEQTQDILERNPNLPFVNIGYQLSTELTFGNLLGSLFEPLVQPNMQELLSKCEEYNIKHAPVNTKSSGKTRLFRSLVGHSDGIQEVRKLIEQVSPSEANVLILGESGTGKEVVARNIHYMSKRQKGPFIPVNCGAIPGELLESELFGHEKGAFTGAIGSRKGRFELAEGGTLFLDEIGDMPLQMQVKLLRVLQERIYERVGGTKTISCDVRIVAATHRNLESMIEEGTFREDLYYRLNVFPIETPALRERGQDIPLLLLELVSRLEANKEIGVRFTEEALTSLTAHDWPGNVRELSNLVERLAILYPSGLIDLVKLPKKYQYGEIAISDMTEEQSERQALNEMFSDAARLGEPGHDNGIDNGESVVSTSLPSDGVNLKEYLSDLEINLITQALEQQDWVVARAADQLGMRRTTLVEKMRKYEINRQV